MELSREAATAKGPAETFTGEVWIDPITRGLPASGLNVASVRFTPGATDGTVTDGQPPGIGRNTPRQRASCYPADLQDPWEAPASWGYDSANTAETSPSPS